MGGGNVTQQEQAVQDLQDDLDLLQDTCATLQNMVSETEQSFQTAVKGQLDLKNDKEKSLVAANKKLIEDVTKQLAELKKDIGTINEKLQSAGNSDDVKKQIDGLIKNTTEKLNTLQESINGDIWFTIKGNCAAINRFTVKVLAVKLESQEARITKLEQLVKSLVNNQHVVQQDIKAHHEGMTNLYNMHTSLSNTESAWWRNGGDGRPRDKNMDQYTNGKAGIRAKTMQKLKNNLNL